MGGNEAPKEKGLLEDDRGCSAHSHQEGQGAKDVEVSYETRPTFEHVVSSGYDGVEKISLETAATGGTKASGKHIKGLRDSAGIEDRDLRKFDIKEVDTEDRASVARTNIDESDGVVVFKLKDSERLDKAIVYSKTKKYIRGGKEDRWTNYYADHKPTLVITDIKND